MNITLVRHTKPDIDLNICYGQTDVGLSPDFGDAAAKIAGYFSTRKSFKLYSSPLSRCLTLARELSEESIETDDRLMEASFGEWEGTPWDKLDQETVTQWAMDMVNFTPPGGESLGDLFTRTGEFMNNVAAGNNSDVVLVTHSGFIRCALAHALDLQPEKIFRFHVDFGSLSMLSFENGQFVIKGVNISA